MLEFNVNQICEVLETSSIDQATLFHVREFCNAKNRDSNFIPVKKEITTSSDRKFNQAVTAFLLLVK